ncbi:hypothetical protein FQA39_LY07085 [Lamprigera yunnana]|nr:hypothetical protein FQA39_LY07085 [Lamprigera yunnana]
MSDSDESDYIPDQEFESDISDSDEEFSDSESEDNFIEPRFFGDWKVVSDPFIDSRDTDLFQQDYSYEIHPVIVPTDMNSPKDCFEAFVSPKIVRELCSWTNIRAMMYFEEKHNYEMKLSVRRHLRATSMTIEEEARTPSRKTSRDRIQDESMVQADASEETVKID